MHFAIRETLILFLLPALLISLWLTPLVIRLAHRFNAIDLPDGRKIHVRVVSRLGGLSMFVGLLVPLVSFVDLDRVTVGFIVGVTLAAATGVVDDLYGLTARMKFAGESAASLAFVLVSGQSLLSFGDLFGLGALDTGAFAVPITAFCMVGVMNALNLSDGLDGLAAGFAAVAACFLALGSYMSNDSRSLVILLALLGSVLGFLRYNSFPARLFMGDSGSLILGFTLSALAVMIVQGEGSAPHLAPVTVFGILALPILDTLFVMTRRALAGRSPFKGDKSHLHHRLLAMGFSHSSVVTVMYATIIMFSSVAWSLREHSDWLQFASIGAMAVLVYATVYLVESSTIRPFSFVVRRIHAQSPAVQRQALAGLLARSGKPLGFTIVAALAAPVLFISSSPNGSGISALSAGIFVAALFPWRTFRFQSSLAQAHLLFGLLILLGFYHLLPESPRWIASYLLVLTFGVLVWVILKFSYRQHERVFLFSPHEVLVIGLSVFLVALAIPAVGADKSTVQTMFAVMLEAVVFLIAFKIIFQRMPEGRIAVLGALLFALGLLAVRGFTDSKPPLDSPAVRLSSPPSARPTSTISDAGFIP